MGLDSFNCIESWQLCIWSSLYYVSIVWIVDAFRNGRGFGWRYVKTHCPFIRQAAEIRRQWVLFHVSCCTLRLKLVTVSPNSSSQTKSLMNLPEFSFFVHIGYTTAKYYFCIIRYLSSTTSSNCSACMAVATVLPKIWGECSVQFAWRKSNRWMNQRILTSRMWHTLTSAKLGSSHSPCFCSHQPLLGEDSFRILVWICPGNEDEMSIAQEWSKTKEEMGEDEIEERGGGLIFIMRLYVDSVYTP